MPSKKTKKKDEFMEGSIVRIKMENFVTYTSCEILPGPYLNAIIGPNGTGKSSVVCAICLGLAGKTQVLGRAKDIGEFVKHGAEKATIEIELYNPKGANWVVKREIHRQREMIGSRSTWYLQGKAAKQRDVEEMIGSLNIQVSNLCQFLPQDKVADFAKMNSYELLESTQKSVGSQDMYEQHMRLKELRGQEKNMLKKHNELVEHKEKLVKMNQRLEEDVRKFHNRQRHMRHVELLEQKKPWVEYVEKRSEFLTLKEQKDELALKVRDARRKNEPMAKKAEVLEHKKQELDQDMRQKLSEFKTNQQTLQRKRDRLTEQEEEIKDAQEELKQKKTKEEKRKKTVLDWKKSLDGYQKELDEIPESSDIKPEIEKNSNRLRQIGKELSKIDSECSSIRRDIEDARSEMKELQDQLKVLNDQRNVRLRFLEQRRRDTYAAVKWLQANKDMFKKPIHEPVMLVLNVHKQEHVRYIEKTIPEKELWAFVCEDTEDHRLFMSEVRDKQKLRISAVSMEPTHLPNPQRPIDALRRWGFEYYLTDLFDGPPAVLAYLCKQYRMHNIPLGTKWTQDNVKKVIDESGLWYFYTPHEQYSVNQSKYGNRKKTSRSTGVTEPKILSISIDMTAKRNLEMQLQQLEQRIQMLADQYKQHEQERKGLTMQDNQLRDERKQLLNRQNRRKTVMSHIKQKTDAIAKSEREALDSEAEEQKFKQKVRSINSKKVKLIVDYKDILMECSNKSKERVIIAFKYALVTSDKAHLEEERRETSALLQQVTAQHKEISDLAKETKDEARNLLCVAKRKTDTGPNEDLDPELKEIFKNYPGTVTEIEDMIHEETVRANSCYQTDARVVEEYNEREKEIAETTEELDKHINFIETHKTEIEEGKQRWLPPLRELIAKVNVSFTDFFSQMGCAGEVALDYENEDDFDRYGITIRVKFRANEQLRELTSHYQSGGERSVSTILYLMALQEINKCPFRVVDEINQGMDPNNERKVFEFMVQTACREATSQYFLITPKLLPNLKYGPKMAIHCVFNGHWVDPHLSWNIDKFIQRQREAGQ
ncbi:structural maintenance of chromosomes protein 5-like [Antedon mediterranea]|uniref:structural maintenance of chromosomes protein 5-like n=1 Tax=Antedon mediterranea TaxID=105859 RepID=UPI003AF73B4B